MVICVETEVTQEIEGSKGEEGLVRMPSPLCMRGIPLSIVVKQITPKRALETRTILLCSQFYRPKIQRGLSGDGSSLSPRNMWSR